jgi:predicted signal transduction protein with EAL and GGDEF domain
VAKALDAPHRIVDRSVSVPATVGVALGDGQSEVDALMRAADTAMYEARATGAGDSVQLARPDTNARAAREARLARDLPDALPSAAVRLAYQPLVHLPSRRVVGAEGLARWKHPELGAIPPSEFVPLAEVRRLGPQLARMAIDSVARDLARWRASTRISPSFNVNINLTARQLAEPEVVEHVMGLCAGGELPRGCLGVEITETALFDRPDDMQKAIAELRKVGVHFALDDFGTGYSSLSHLVDYPVATVKIDRSLVARLGHDPVATHLVAGVLGLSDSLGLTVVAEGVETVDQERILVNLGCGLAQGWLYGRAVAASQFERLLVEAGHDDSGDVTAMLEEG